VLLLEEPTRGVDVGSRHEIYRLLWDLAASGCAVLMFCTEATEVFDAASRVHVVSDGRMLAAVQVEHRHVEELASELASLELASSRRDGNSATEKE
jgi:ABC-type sugar transport system ATPase subunit